MKWCRIEWIIPCCRFIEKSGISDRTSEISWSIKWWCHRNNTIATIASISWLPSDNSTHACWLSDTSTSICPESYWHDTTSNRSCWSWRRSSWNTSRIPWIMSDSKSRILSTWPHSIFVHICFSEWDKSCFLHAKCDRRFIRRNESLKHIRSCLCEYSFLTKNIFHGNRKTCYFFFFWKHIENTKFFIILLCSFEKIIIYFLICCISIFYEIFEFEKGKIFEFHSSSKEKK